MTNSRGFIKILFVSVADEPVIHVGCYICTTKEEEVITPKNFDVTLSACNLSKSTLKPSINI